jgi:hypothetical protein
MSFRSPVGQLPVSLVNVNGFETFRNVFALRPVTCGTCNLQLLPVTGHWRPETDKRYCASVLPSTSFNTSLNSFSIMAVAPQTISLSISKCGACIR